jgi:hypothetical protein
MGGEDAAVVTKLSTREYLDRIEARYSTRLRGVSLAAEVPFHESHVGDTARALGRLYKQARAARRDGTLEWRSRPAAVVLGLTSFAASAYRGSGWWTEIRNLVDLPEWDNADAEAWGSAFRRACGRLGLPVMETDDGRHHIGPIIVHAGVPDYCVGGLLDEVLRLRRHLFTSDGAEIVAAILARGRPPSLHQPAYEFLRNGGIYAHDVVERLIDAVDLAASGQDPDHACLPDRIGRQVRSLLDETPAITARVASHATTDAPRARLVLEPWGDGLVLLVPPDDHQSWRVTLDGRYEDLPWTDPQVAASRRPRRVPLRRPVRLISAHPLRASAPTIQLYDAAVPLAAFTADGVFLPAPRALPAADAWLLHPADRPLAVADDRIREEAELPLGWHGWTLRRYNLEGLESIGFHVGPRRAVLRRDGPRLSLPSADLVLTDEGAPVYTRRPVLHLPVQEVGSWRVSVQRTLDTDVARRFVPDSHQVELWASDSPVIGRFEILVRGPLGRGLRQRISVAEQVAAACSPAVRGIGERGLSPAQVEVAGAATTTIEPAHLTLDGNTPDAAVTVAEGDERLLLTVTPPHRWLARSSAGSAVERHYAPLMLLAEDLTGDDPGTLDVGGPTANGQPRLHLVTKEAEQVIAPTITHRRDRASFDLRSISDTVRRNAVGDLFLLTTSASDRALVARIRPARLFDGAQISDGMLRLDHFCGRDDVAVAVWVARAPWRPPVLLHPDSGGCVQLGPLNGCGPLLVQAAVDDPWVPWQPPEWPSGNSAAPVLQPGLPDGEDADEAQLIAFIAGETDDPGHDLNRLWRLLGRPTSVVTGRRDLLIVAGRHLRRHLVAALVALVDAPPPPDRLPELLIRSGLASHRLTSVPESVRSSLWQINPALGVLAGGKRLCLVEDQAPRVDRLMAEQICGDAVAHLLDEGSDPYQTTAAFDGTADALEAMPVQALRRVLQATALVPQADLDGDTRTLGAVELFQRRNEAGLRVCCRDAGHLVRRCQTTLQEAGLAAAVEAVERRRHPAIREGWRELTALSLALALVARSAARGQDAAVVVDRAAREQWAALASAAARLVTTDLALAELWLIREHDRERSTPE